MAGDEIVNLQLEPDASLRHLWPPVVNALQIDIGQLRLILPNGDQIPRASRSSAALKDILVCEQLVEQVADMKTLQLVEQLREHLVEQVSDMKALQQAGALQVAIASQLSDIRCTLSTMFSHCVQMQ
jgi:hypothetical protein